MKKIIACLFSTFALAAHADNYIGEEFSQEDTLSSQVISHSSGPHANLKFDIDPPLISIPGAEDSDGHLTHQKVLIAGTPVVSSPYFGVQTQFDGGDLVVNASSVNKDVALLNVRRDFYKALRAHGLRAPSHTIIELSGFIEPVVFFRNDFTRDYQSDIDLGAAELDIFGAINPWTSVFVQMAYDGSRTMPKRTANSRIQIDSAFATFGNLTYAPWYATIGQLYVPFGQYSSTLITRSLARDLGRTKERPIVLGMDIRESVYHANASVFAFQGDTKKGGDPTTPPDHINGGGANFSFAYAGTPFFWDAGVSYITNLAESDGMQGRAFGTSQANEVLKHRVPGLDLRGKLGYKQVHVGTEYVTALRHFSATNLSYQGTGASPSALHVEGVFKFALGEAQKPGAIVIGYDHSREAAALGFPQDRYSIGASYAPLRATIVSVEYRHDSNYTTSALPAAVQTVGINTAPLGRDANTFTVQLDIFF